MQKTLRVLVIGPAASAENSRGGMATVVSLMLANPAEHTVTENIATYVDASRVRKLWVGVCGLLRASWILSRNGADVLHVHLAHGGSVLRKSVPMAVARCAGIPVVVHAHSYDFGGWFDTLPRLGRDLVRKVMKADRWLVLGSGLAVEYATRLNIDPSTVTVLYNPVSIPAARADQHDDEPTRIVALGRLGQRKGSFDLIDAVAALPPRTRSRIAVTMCGDGEVDAVRSAAASAGVAEVVTVAGWTPPEACAELLSTAQIFALPSYSEGLPMALLEAMSHGLVPVCTPVGSVAEAVTTDVDGVLVQPGAVNELAAALDMLVWDGVARRRLADGAREKSAQFDVGLWYDRLDAIWRDVVRGR